MLLRVLAGAGLLLALAVSPAAGADGQPASGLAAGSSGGMRESSSSLGMENALGEPRVSRRTSKIFGGPVTITEPGITIPTVQVPQVNVPHVAAPQAPQMPDPEPRNAPVVPPREWRTLEPGLEYGEFPFIALRYGVSAGDAPPPRATLRVVRIDPARFDFVLCAASDGGVPLPLGRWADRMELVAAINASMYLTDGRTSTGYLRAGQHINNARHGARLGAYFMAGPDALARIAGAPAAAVEDGTQGNMAALEPHYQLVVQNFRMISADRRIVWGADSRPVAIAAVAQTGDGHILFLHCRQPVEPYVLAQRLLDLPLDVRTVMYVEGGAQAGLLLRAGGLFLERYGRSAAAILLGEPPAPSLPNVLGIRRKALSAK